MGKPKRIVREVFQGGRSLEELIAPRFLAALHRQTSVSYEGKVIIGGLPGIDIGSDGYGHRPEHGGQLHLHR